MDEAAVDEAAEAEALAAVDDRVAAVALLLHRVRAAELVVAAGLIQTA